MLILILRKLQMNNKTTTIAFIASILFTGVAEADQTLWSKESALDVTVCGQTPETCTDEDCTIAENYISHYGDKSVPIKTFRDKDTGEIVVVSVVGYKHGLKVYVGKVEKENGSYFAFEESDLDKDECPNLSI